MIKSRLMRSMGHAACLGEIISIYNILVGKSEDKK
jgi:hypothetical protein